MICLGIESSCDDTSLALVEDGKLLGQTSSSQVPLHALFGGVVPEMASREHGRLIGFLCDELFAKTKITQEDVDLVAVARGPGLLGSLLVGISFAKAFALGSGANFIGVNHLHAHLLAAGLDEELAFPALGLLVSGGHTQIYRIDAPNKFTILGTTLDDAAGEAFDKAGKMLGLPYPAGKFMDMIGKNAIPEQRMFPRPYLDNDNLNFSFSGLKTAMSSYLAKNPVNTADWNIKTGVLSTKCTEDKLLQKVCASYTLAIVETLLVKTRKALAREKDIKALILAGGVAANSTLRTSMQGLAEQNALRFQVPRIEFCADNGAMIAHLGEILAKQGSYHGLDMQAIPRGQKIPEDMLCHDKGKYSL